MFYHGFSIVFHFYYIINDLNEAYQQALETMEDGTFKKLKLAEFKP